MNYFCNSIMIDILHCADQMTAQAGKAAKSLDGRAMRLLEDGLLNKAEFNARFGQKKVSGQFNNKVKRSLQVKQLIESTIHDKPHRQAVAGLQAN